MLEKIYGTVTVKTDRISSKMTIPMKGNVKGQLKSLLIVVKQVLEANGDKQLIDELNDLQAVIKLLAQESGFERLKDNEDITKRAAKKQLLFEINS